MTAIDTRAAVTGAPARIANVMRMHVANPMPTLIMPWIITAIVFGVNLSIWLMVANAAGGAEYLEPRAFQYNGGVSWIVIFMMVVAVQAMSLTFRFALGFSVTRREYYLGTAAYFVGLALLYSTGLTGLAALERATDGWGLDAAFFAPFGLVDESLGLVWLLYLMTMLLFFFLGSAIATVWVRWRAYGLYSFFIGLALLLVAAGWGITAADAWGDVGEFLTTTPLAQLAAWTLPVTALCAVVGFLFLRRATPRA
ncbi:ABC transporter permease [uncultured Demequina sp.]|uniref:ABC transporter permease n=1 Tax=uncultured Demequina sp. TaxID=693499 RepID=UPI0025DA9C24|nr:ABC transporter permease [uncultured Demequina sp.]